MFTEGFFTSVQVDAERIIKAGGVYFNYQRVTQPDFVLIPGEHILPNNVTLIRIGETNNIVIVDFWVICGFL